jgi:hypothetical protein
MIKFRCPSCQIKLGVPDDYVNRRIRCNQCGQPCVVPKPIVEVSVKPSVQPTPKSPAVGVTTLPVSQNQPANIELQQSPASQQLDQLDFVDDSQTDIQEDPNAVILKQVRQDKMAKQKVKNIPAKPVQAASVKTGRRERSDSSFSLTEIVPDALHFPLSLVLGLLAVCGFIGIWIVAAQKTQNPLTFFTMLIPWAAAGGIRLLAVNRTFALGTLAAVMGIAGIGIGRVVVAKTVVVPLLNKIANQEILVDLKTLLADPRGQLSQGESAKSIANDGDFITCIAIVAAVDQDGADPAVARKLALDIIRASKKTNIIEMVSQAGTGTASREASAQDEPELSQQESDVMNKAYDHLSQWEDVTDTPKLAAARKYYPALSKLIAQCKLQQILEDPQKAFHFALLSTLSLLEVVWLLAGLCGAYVLAAFDL